MPTFSIVTNVPKHKIPSTFLADASKFVSEVLQTPELYIAVKIKAGQQMNWFSTKVPNEEPCALGSIAGTLKLGLDENNKYAPLLQGYIEKHIGVPTNRCYLSFSEQKPSNIGVKGTTLEEIIQ
ncbi:macrophage migration inhibitory factor-like [Melanaphis sacchari]|uniref:L-dopachrome isomerase n=1 Tax=Melanaphis sacchari TaxID=742174 RepID=A0A2H8TXL5_9HEMI|nr:macrophage migration inhibitory factor-like [Melanaphis sacchari]